MKKNTAGRPKGSISIPETLSQNDLNNLINSIKDSNHKLMYRNITLVLFNYIFGLTANELIQIRISDVFDVKRMKLKSNFTIGKNNRRRQLSLNHSILIIYLNKFIKQRIDNSSDELDFGDNLFVSQKKNFSVASLTRALNNIYKKAGFKNTTSMTGKYNYYNKLVSLNSNNIIISRYTGDSIMNITRYKKRINEKPK